MKKQSINDDLSISIIGGTCSYGTVRWFQDGNGNDNEAVASQTGNNNTVDIDQDETKNDVESSQISSGGDNNLQVNLGTNAGLLLEQNWYWQQLCHR